MPKTPAGRILPVQEDKAKNGGINKRLRLFDENSKMNRFTFVQKIRTRFKTHKILAIFIASCTKKKCKSDTINKLAIRLLNKCIYGHIMHNSGVSGFSVLNQKPNSTRRCYI